MTFDPMRRQLIRLARKLQRDSIKLIIGGGYGLILKQEYLRKTGAITRFADPPEDRSTNDIDIFLGTEIITSAEKMEKIKAVLKEFGYESVADFFQFAVDKDDPKQRVKIDFLAPPVSEVEKELVKINRPRIRPKKASKIHGYLTDEALTVEEELIAFDLSGSNESVLIFLPHPFTYLILKLFALRDRLEDEGKSFGAYHAFDIYRVIGMMTEEEWKAALRLRDKYADALKIVDASQIADDLFSSRESIGVLRLHQHARDAGIIIEDEKVSALINDLKELFPNENFTLRSNGQ